MGKGSDGTSSPKHTVYNLTVVTPHVGFVPRKNRAKNVIKGETFKRRRI